MTGPTKTNTPATRATRQTRTSGPTRATRATQPGSPLRTLAEPARHPRTGAAAPAHHTGWAPRLERAALRATGTALALAAAGTGDGTLTDRLGPVSLLPVAVGALWAAVPAPDASDASGAPPAWLARLSATRTTLLAAASVLLAALGEPSWWRALAVTVLLAGHLLLLDAFGPRHPSIRPASAAAALTAALLVLPPAFAPATVGEWSRPLAALGLAAAAVGVGLALRPERTEPPADQPPPADGPARSRDAAGRRPAGRRH
ncbi:hypothetical protein [Kitasatospora sp. NPDC097691]|uniref:hypothetical protein n=1 Tax=Kitasatospora sp. NPDC097691 TaxID=3157231 RepID=UPI00331BCED2